MNRVIVVTAVHNRHETTKTFINNLKKQTFENWFLLLVDDGSTDGTSQMVEKSVKNHKILNGDGNLWWAGALQMAYNWIVNNSNDDDIIYIANDDIEIPFDFIETALKILSNNPLSLLSATGINIDKNTIGDSPIKNNYLTFKSKTEIYDGSADCCTTRSIFIKVKDFIKTGGFRPKLLPHYGSDYEFTIRAHRKGIKIIGNANLKYYYSEETSGNKKYLTENTKSAFHKLFMKKSIFNPVYGIIYIVLITPWYILPIALIHKLIRYLINVIKFIKSRFR